MAILDGIESPGDLKKLNIEELKQLAEEIREYMIDVLSNIGGHIAPNLGIVELTLALHYVFNSPEDKIIWDVGHQSYPHKIITGRKNLLPTIRQFGGISGFTKRDESPHDIFGAGHASTSLSAALGLATARDLLGQNFHVIAVIGDGALTGGMALEALNNIGQLKKDMIVILNDNDMSIAENVGAVSSHLSKLVSLPLYFKFKEHLWELLDKLPSETLSKKAKILTKKLKEGLKNLAIPTIVFEEFGFEYIGPLDGHDIKLLIDTLDKVKEAKGPILIHILTKKGKGYKPAEEKTELFHGLGPFNKETGEPIKKPGPPRYTKVFGDAVVELAKRDEKVVAITAAMPLGTGLDKFREEFPDRFFDVGIAEQHAVTFAGGLSLLGIKPFVAIYSTFLQRAYDQIIHDVALQKLPVKFFIDRGGLVGEDGPTHHGAFDLSYLRLIPNMVIMAPKDADEFRNMIYTAYKYNKGPIALRYPRDRVPKEPDGTEFKEIAIGSWEMLKEGGDAIILAVGTMVLPSLRVSLELEKEGISIGVVNARFVKPMDVEMLRSIAEKYNNIITIEENTKVGGFGAGVLENLAEMGYKGRVKLIGIPDTFIEHGNRKKLLEVVGLDEQGIKKQVLDFIG